MSITGFDLRKRLRRGAVRVLDGLLERLERDEATVADAPPPAPPPSAPVAEAPATVPAPAPAPKLPPLPEPTPRTAPLGAQRPAAPAVPAEPEARKVGETEAARKAKASPEDRQKQHWERTRRGLLRFVAEHGDSAGLRELHDHSERTYFVAHVGFSRLMEELTAEGLLDYDHDTAIATLTDAGKALADA